MERSRVGPQLIVVGPDRHVAPTKRGGSHESIPLDKDGDVATTKLVISRKVHQRPTRAGALDEGGEEVSVPLDAMRLERACRLDGQADQSVLQEIWGHLCCHYAIRTLMFEAAHDADVDPDRVSFVAALRIIRRSLSGARDFFP